MRPLSGIVYEYVRFVGASAFEACNRWGVHVPAVRLSGGKLRAVQNASVHVHAGGHLQAAEGCNMMCGRICTRAHRVRAGFAGHTDDFWAKALCFRWTLDWRGNYRARAKIIRAFVNEFYTIMYSMQ